MLRLMTLSLFLVGCSDKKESAPPQDPPPTSSAANEARDTFNTLCSVCHGQSGTGDGPGAASLNPKPRNYTDKAWQASITDDQIRTIILEGGAAVGKSQMMPPSPQFKDKPAVVDELVKIVRGFGR
jgi:cytochrome c553